MNDCKDKNVEAIDIKKKEKELITITGLETIKERIKQY